MIQVLSIVALLGLTSPAHAEAEGDTPAEAKAEITWATCDGMYANYVHGLPKPKQNEEFDLWWAVNDTQYWYTRANDANYKEAKPNKMAEFEKAVAAAPQPSNIQARVKVGAYDVKKKGFPVDIAVANKEKWIEDQASGMRGGIGGNSSSIRCPGGVAVSPINKRLPPGEAHFIFTNLDKAKFIPCAEDKAKTIGETIGGSQTLAMTFHFTPGKSSLQKSFYGGPDLVTEAKITSASIGKDDAKCDANYDVKH